jgi:hypothetical protein
LPDSEDLENAIKISARPQPLFLHSRLNNREALAISLVSGEKVFLHSELHPRYFESVLIHEISEILQNTFTPFKQMALALDFDYLSSKKGLDLKTSRMEIDVPVSELKCSLELSGWQDYSDAGAIYSQLDSLVTPPDLSGALLDELTIHNKSVGRKYLDLEEIVARIKVKCVNASDPRVSDVGKKPLTSEIKDFLLRMLFGTLEPETLDERFKILANLPESEIPVWNFPDSEPIARFVRERFLEEKLDLMVGPNQYSIINSYILFPWVCLLQDELTRAVSEELTIGLCQDCYAYFVNEPVAFPIALYVAPDLSNPFENKRLLACRRPNVLQPARLGAFLEQCDVTADRIEASFVDDHDDDWVTRFACTSAVDLRAMQIVMMCVEQARRSAFDKCRICTRAADCESFGVFLTRLQRELPDLREAIKRISPSYLRTADNKTYIRLPLFRNYPSQLAKETSR